MSDNVYSVDEISSTRSITGRYSSTGNASKALKRSVDLIGASVGLLLLSPLLLFIAAAVKFTSKGPVLFCQRRHGLNGETFVAYKFRSMYTKSCDTSGVQQTVKDDPRITPLGRFLRRSNFDELPQLLNVLEGKMSLVGPRPHVPGMLANGVPYEEFDSRYQSRHKVRPGITGLAQVRGFRGETKDAYAARMRLEYDLDYIESQSTLLDIRIMFETVMKEFFGGKGY
ncbi:sugar transferase [Roseibium sp.]|uniref:sugar transferase n=1 Tax=Roseibium sp. TaxID=1936156 RepID=UPI0026176C1A|nr:sugar transferase [Roseibium sp.]